MEILRRRLAFRGVEPNRDNADGAGQIETDFHCLGDPFCRESRKIAQELQPTLDWPRGRMTQSFHIFILIIILNFVNFCPQHCNNLNC